MAIVLANLSKMFVHALGNELPPFLVVGFWEQQVTPLSLSEWNSIDAVHIFETSQWFFQFLHLHLMRCGGRYPAPMFVSDSNESSE
jgi:hypothetical protein